MKLRRNAKIELLRSVPLFSGCSQKELGQISAIADELYQPDGTTLIDEGTRGREFFVLVRGDGRGAAQRPQAPDDGARATSSVRSRS